MENATSNISDRVQLLLHTEDGFIPFLTPYLLQTYFSPNSKDIKEHLVLGVAIKDTCIGPIYRNDTTCDSNGGGSNSNNNKEGGEKDDKPQSNNKQKKKRKRNGSSNTDDVYKERSHDTKRQRTDNSSSDTNERKGPSVSNTLKPIGYKFNSIVHKRLLSAQIPGYNKVLVPSFDLIDDLTEFTSERTSNVNENNYGKKKKDDNGQDVVNKKDTTNNNQNGNHRPTIASTNNQISLCTPHGVQKLDFDTYSKITREVQVDSFFGMYDQVHVHEKKKRREKCIDRTTNWLKKTMNEQIDQKNETKRVWYPIDCNAIFPNEKSFGSDISSKIPPLNDYISGIVLVGWHHRKSKEERIKLLQMSLNLTQTMSSKFIVPATNDMSQIIEVVKHGASMFGCDLAAKWARARKALALTLTPGQNNNNDNGTNTKIGDLQKLDENGCIDLSDPSFAWDKSPLIPSCECFSAKYTRSYIHHLIQAKELLADIILFGHNLYQMILLCKEFTAARQEGKINECCTFLQGQLKTNYTK